jgi:uncharacterized protein YjdB
MLCNAKQIFTLLTLIPFLVLSACSSSTASSTGTERIPVVQLFQDSATIAVGDTFAATLLPMLPPGYVPSVEWSSSQPGVASVGATTATSATVRGLQAGHAVIHVAGDGSQDSLRVTVTSH